MADANPPPGHAALRDRRISSIRPLVAPAVLRAELALGTAQTEVVLAGRDAVTSVLEGSDPRLLVIVGPCSVHDPIAALDYATRLAELARRHAEQLLVVMRVYFEKPRTTLGWKGLINDPHLDASFDVNHGLRTARRLLLDVLSLGLPVGCEFLDPISPQYLADTVSWGSIGARTAQSQVHRQLCSGLSMPIGIKNGTEGDVQAAVDACRAAAASHVFAGITEDGTAAILTTHGNPDCHVVLRGAQHGPNYDPQSVAAALTSLSAAGLPARLVVDASHGNSGKDPARQPAVLGELVRRRVGGERGVVGVMLESFLAGGRQDLALGSPEGLIYGQSVTDACLSWPETERLLDDVAGVLAGRSPSAAPAAIS